MFPALDMYFSIYSSQKSYDQNTINIPISKIKKLRFRVSDLSKVKIYGLYLETSDSQPKTSCTLATNASQPPFTYL